jgi:hypothetical protein
MADYHPSGILSLEGEGDEKASPLHELSLIPFPEEKGTGAVDSPFHQLIFIKVPNNQLYSLPFDQGETMG